MPTSRSLALLALCALLGIVAPDQTHAQLTEATDAQIAALEAFKNYFESGFPGTTPQVGGTTTARCSFTYQGVEVQASAFRYPLSMADTLARRYADPSPERSRDVNGRTALVSYNPPGGHGSASIKWRRLGFEVKIVGNHPTRDSRDLLNLFTLWARELDAAMTQGDGPRIEGSVALLIDNTWMPEGEEERSRLVSVVSEYQRRTHHINNKFPHRQVEQALLCVNASGLHVVQPFTTTPDESWLPRWLLVPATDADAEGFARGVVESLIYLRTHAKSENQLLKII
ncbi:MAG: hypothetical protein GF393_03845, partial [Armatimonadia bacterium]|nr:hypothetical protein [Armatimonadia bacterium]